MKNLVMLSVILGIAITLFSCKEGPQGPQGPQGVSGTADFSNTTFVINTNEWNQIPLEAEYQFLGSVSSITNYNTDDVLCYMQPANSKTWYALPTSDLLTSGDAMTFGVDSAVVVVNYFNDGSPSVTLNLKVLVIPPIQLAKMKVEKINLNDYNEVDAYIKLNSE